MDKLIMNINDYKSINKASIEINKINVVSGVNGSGKSTLSRILYSFLKGNSTKRRDYLLERIVEGFNEIIKVLDRDYVDYDFPEAFKITDTEEEIFEKYNSLHEITKKHDKICKSKVEELDQRLAELFKAHIKQLQNEGFEINEEIIDKMLKERFEADMKELCSEKGEKILNYEEDDEWTFKLIGLADFVQEWDNEGFDDFFKEFVELDKQKDYYSKTNLVHFTCNLVAESLKQYLDEDSYHVSKKCFQSLLIKEEKKPTRESIVNFKIELSDYSKSNPYEYFFNKGFIDNVYYFDNISIFDLYFLNTHTEYKIVDLIDNNDNNVDFDILRHIRNFDILRHTNDFLDELSERNVYEYDDEVLNSILEKIESIIGGRYFNIIIPMFHSNKEDSSNFRGLFREKGITTTTDTPSGIKQMGILQLLLLNNKIHKGDYLIIDEPEVNLHPEWQFKFAEILVLLAKQLDVTIYINSHSPLFIESISAFSEFYDIPEDVNYYLTEPSEAEGKYDFVKITSDELYRLYDNLGNAYDLIDQLRLKKYLGE